jgi:hypothetical protein
MSFVHRSHGAPEIIVPLDLRPVKLARGLPAAALRGTVRNQDLLVRPFADKIS